jgi:nicotinamidase/pyrazinamidase
VGDLVDLHGIDQILWPDHCVQHTPGAELVTALLREPITEIFHKGTDPTIDSYSAFYDNAKRRDTGLAAYLKQREVTELVLVGLALDYCVKFTALDGRGLGFDVTLVTDGTRAVNLQPGDDDRALAELREAGVRLVDSSAIG